VANGAPRRNLLIDTGRHNGSLSIHKRFHRCVCGRTQQILDRHDAEEPVTLTDDKMARTVVSMTNQKFAHLTDALTWCCGGDARGGVLSGGFEGQMEAFSESA
jgi:hypothetical protein